MPSRIEDYGLIGNMRTGALISRTGSLDWLCVPRFDSPACFASLLGYDQHGNWSIMPTCGVRERHQRYRDDTLILETDVVCESGAVRLTELMPPADRAEIVRIVEGLEGEVPLQMVLLARFDYGSKKPWTTRISGGFRLVAGPDAVLIRGPVDMHECDRGVVSSFTVKKGERIGLTFTWYPSHLPEPPILDVEKELENCERF